MIVIGVLVSFVVGAVVAVQLVAALFGVVDLGYRLPASLPPIVLRMSFWVVLTLGLGWMLGGWLRVAYAAGLLAYAAFFGWLFFAEKRLIPYNANRLTR